MLINGGDRESDTRKGRDATGFDLGWIDEVDQSARRSSDLPDQRTISVSSC
jgi:hypothetical protein